MRALPAAYTLKQTAIPNTLRSETGKHSGHMAGNPVLPLPETPVQISAGTDLAADRAQEMLLEKLHQVMNMLDGTMMPARMAQAVEELKESTAFQLRSDSVRERTTVALGGGPAGQTPAATAVISDEIPDPGAALGGASPNGTDVCVTAEAATVPEDRRVDVTAEAATVPEDRRVDDDSAGEDGCSGTMALPEPAQETSEKALRIELPQGEREVPLHAAATRGTHRRPLEEEAMVDCGLATSQAGAADCPSDDHGCQLMLAPAEDGIPPGRPPDGQPPGCKGGQTPGFGGGDVPSHALSHGGGATASVNVTTVKMKAAGRPREVGHYLLRQRVFVSKVDGKVGRDADLLFRLDLPVSLITFGLAKEFGLTPTSMPRRIATPFGREERSDQCFNLEIRGRPGETPVTVRLWGDDTIMYCSAQRSPPGMNMRFPKNTVPSEFLWLPPGEMQLLLADDHHWLHPQLLCPSSVRNETLALYISRFRRRPLIGGSFARLAGSHMAEAGRQPSSEARRPLPKPLEERSVISDNTSKISTASGTTRHDPRPLSARRSASYLLHDNVGDLHPPICQPQPQVRLPGRRAARLPPCPAGSSTASPATSLPTGTSNNSLIRLVPEKPGIPSLPGSPASILSFRSVIRSTACPLPGIPGHPAPISSFRSVINSSACPLPGMPGVPGSPADVFAACTPTGSHSCKASNFPACPASGLPACPAVSYASCRTTSVPASSSPNYAVCPLTGWLVCPASCVPCPLPRFKRSETQSKNKEAVQVDIDSSSGSETEPGDMSPKSCEMASKLQLNNKDFFKELGSWKGDDYGTFVKTREEDIAKENRRMERRTKKEARKLEMATVEKRRL